MILFLLAWLGGVLTILSPCILPVLPFVFARADRPFLRAGLPLLIGMAVTFAAIATLATVGGSWAVHANSYGRAAALILLALFGLTLLFPALADRLTRPLVALGDRLSARAGAEAGIGSSLLLGAATGLLWAPCAGPILGLILTGAAIKGASASTTLLLLAYALGAATSLAAALLIGGRVFAAMKRSLGAGEWIRRVLGALVLAGVAAIALGLDTGFLTRISTAQTASLEQALVNRTGMGHAVQHIKVAGSDLPVEGTMPPLTGATLWLNSRPLTREELRGKVVLVDFWTYSCINCLRALPYVKAWAAKYGPHGLVVIGVHAPEFAFEKDEANVRKAVKDLGITYPVALDNDYAIWQAFGNQYWPAHYFIDAQGRIRHHHFGEGDYAGSEKVIQQLLKEAGRADVPGGVVSARGTGAEAAADTDAAQSPETYIGYGRAQNFASGPAKQDMAASYETPFPLRVNQWALSGQWIIGREKAVLAKAGGTISFRFHARDLHLVMGADSPVRIRVTIDGQKPGADHGVDIDTDGNGVVQGQRLYQLVRQQGAVQDRTFRIEFLDPGAQAFSFTFG
ncbi:MAG: cytochrome C biogenesis protein [Alphaproteobacteria bacterium 64-11]|nr:redoxin family protein [Alphaproteobacteria bacterium]OJU13887.1 MAG: cytochrome C biogenesis protein [Alphaproteobacteria bacterium 64-11]